jgi:hypothetical protein
LFGYVCGHGSPSEIQKERARGTMALKNEDGKA